MTKPRLPPTLWAAWGIPADYAATRHLPLQQPARRLVLAGRSQEGRRIRLTPAAAAAWRRMQQVAAADGIVLVPVSGYRSVARQTALIRKKLAAGAKIGAILRYLAAPGCSEHHTGRALDLGAPGRTELDARFARTRQFRWLRQHAATFGFRLSYPRLNPHGIGYEPWHWCWHQKF